MTALRWHKSTAETLATGLSEPSHPDASGATAHLVQQVHVVHNVMRCATKNLLHLVRGLVAKS